MWCAAVRAPGYRASWIALLLLCGCLVPPPEQPANGTAESGRSKHADRGAPKRFYDPSWADCSGVDGKGGVKLNMGPKKIAQRRDDLSPKLSSDAATKDHRD